jgi:hypothetical protein
MSKLLSIISLCIITFGLTACNEVNNNVATTEQITQENSFTQEIHDPIVWKNYDKKLSTLKGVKYPEDFIISFVSTDDSTEGKGYFRFELVSSKDLDIFKCPESLPPQSGMWILIQTTKQDAEFIDVDRNNFEKTIYSNILKRKLDYDGTIVAPSGDYIVEHNTICSGFVRDEYLYSPKQKGDGMPAYNIIFVQKNFTGDSAAIIDGILSSLYEE